MHLSGRHFVISVDRPAARATSDAAGNSSPAGVAKPMMSVPKKLVPSSPLRNAVRRVVREAVRAAGAAALPPMLVRLASLPELDVPPPGARRAFDRRLPDGAFKRACRADLDELLARVARLSTRRADGKAGDPVDAAGLTPAAASSAGAGGVGAGAGPRETS